MKINTSMRVKTQIVEAATGKIVKNNPWRKNLVMDYGLDGLAKRYWSGATPANSFAQCLIGSGSNPTKVTNPSNTFTQTGNLITSVGVFFTYAMIGSIFKWGTGSGGVERRITNVYDAHIAQVDVSETVGTPDAATVWMVQQTALFTPLYTSSTYKQTAGSNGTTSGPTSITMWRTFQFAQQAAPYNVNEIGWNLSSSTVFGRIVLPSTDVVGILNTYVVTLELTLTITPNVPTAVGNIGENVDSSGTAMVEQSDFAQVGADGNASDSSVLDGNAFLNYYIVPLSQRAEMNGEAPESYPDTQQVDIRKSWAYKNPAYLGRMDIEFSGDVTPAFDPRGWGPWALGLCASNATQSPPSFDVIFSGYHQWDVIEEEIPIHAVFSLTFGRTLVN